MMKKIILTVIVVILVVACSESNGPTSPSKQTDQISSQNQIEKLSSSSLMQNNDNSTNGVSYGTYAYGGGTVVRTVSLPDGTTYTMASSTHCPSDWHKMTYEECKKLHQYGSDLDPAVFIDPFNVNKTFCSYGRSEYSCEFYATGHCSEKGITSTEGQSKSEISNTRCVKGIPSSSSNYFGVRSSSSSFSKDSCVTIKKTCTYFTMYSTGGCRCEDDKKSLLSSSFVDSDNKMYSSKVNEVVSSSSSKISRVYLNPELSYGNMIDERDGQEYKTTIINGKVWMAENLNYKTENSWCYSDIEENCVKYGRLYTGDAARNGNLSNVCSGCEAKCNDSISVQGVCPSGWHLPSFFNDVIGLFAKANYSACAFNSTDSLMGKKLKSKEWNGSDVYGFSAIPTGSRDLYSFSELVDAASFWTSSLRKRGENGALQNYIFILYSSRNNVNWNSVDPNVARSVRCVKD